MNRATSDKVDQQKKVVEKIRVDGNLRRSAINYVRSVYNRFLSVSSFVRVEPVSRCRLVANTFTIRNAPGEFLIGGCFKQVV